MKSLVADESAEIKNDSSEGYLFSKSTEVSTTAELQVEAKVTEFLVREFLVVKKLEALIDLKNVCELIILLLKQFVEIFLKKPNIFI